jgi:hypothetical protein
MGLDISYYSDLKFVTSEESDANWNKHTHVYVNRGFTERANGLEDGFYESEYGGGFRAGSYSGYNAWRNRLAVMVGTRKMVHSWS